MTLTRCPVVVINPWSALAIGGNLAAIGAAGAALAGTNAWPAANRALLVPFWLDAPLVVAKMWVSIGGSSGNLDFGIYDVTFTRLASTGSTAGAGSFTLQLVNLAVTLGPGLFYMAMAVDNTTATPLSTTGTAAERLRTIGMVEADSAFPLPATITPEAISSAYVPMFGLGTARMV